MSINPFSYKISLKKGKRDTPYFTQNLLKKFRLVDSDLLNTGKMLTYDMPKNKASFDYKAKIIPMILKLFVLIKLGDKVAIPL
jgi:hypothetical protein